MRRFVYADECGDFAFTRRNASRYYVICTVSMVDPSVGDQLLRLKRDLIFEGLSVGDYFHCSEDSQAVRDRVFDLIRRMDLRIGATIFEKSKAQPQVRSTNDRFYKYGWHYHLQYSHRKLGIRKDDELLITAASIATKKSQAVFTSAVNDVVQQHLSGVRWKSHFCLASADPCLQIADYCAWAIQRKWERADDRSYQIVQHLICHEYDSWRSGQTHYY